MQKSTGSVPGLKDLASFFGHFEVALIPDNGQNMTVMPLSEGAPGSLLAGAGAGLPGGGPSESCQVPVTGAGVGVVGTVPPSIDDS